MPVSKQPLPKLRKIIRRLRKAKRRNLCWEIGWFQAPLFVKEPGETPINPYMLTCIDTASRAVLGNLVLKEIPSPEDYLSLLVASMEAPFPKSSSVLPHSVRLSDSGAVRLLEVELGSLAIELQLVEQLPFLHEFAEVSEREFFSQLSG